MSGSFLLVLHSHLPYVRGAGRWPHGEEWVHEAILGTYLPLLVAFHDLRQEGIDYRVTIGLTPTLLEQLAHPDIRTRALEYIDDQLARAGRDAREAPPSRRPVAEFYRRTYGALRHAFVDRFAGDIVGAFSSLARSGHVQLLTSAATHGYLPLLDEPSVDAQLALGSSTTRRLTGVDPSGLWLPECAYRPGLERVIERHGLSHFFTDAPLLRGQDTRRAARETAPLGARSGSALDAVPGGAAVSRAYRVAGSGVAAIARDPLISGQVWSASLGYPGDPAYREFHRKDDVSGLRYWSVSRTTDLGAKAEYDVAAAAARVREHAAHFSARVREELGAAVRREGPGALVATTFDSELFGHWWFEGVDWLSLVLRDLSPFTRTAAEQLAAFPPTASVDLREGSWGARSDHSTWLALDTAWMWRELAGMSGQLAGLRASPPPTAFGERASRQAVRELLLAQSSDWPFLVTTGQAAEYAAQRFRSHAARFSTALRLARNGSDRDEAALRELERADDLFPDATLGAFAPRAVAV